MYDPRIGPFVPCLGGFDTLANLLLYPTAGLQAGICALCGDAGWMWWDGTSWRAMSLGSINAAQFIEAGAAGTVGVGKDAVILNGVDTTFALTFPAPAGDGQRLRVTAATAVSVAFSAVPTAPATAINTVPATLAAGEGVSWVYRLADTTWYRLY